MVFVMSSEINDLSHERVYDRKTFVPGVLVKNINNHHNTRCAIVIGVTLGELSDSYYFLYRTQDDGMYIFETAKPSWFFKTIV